MIASGRRDVKSTISTGPFSTSLFVCLPEGKSQVFFGVVPEWDLTCFEVRLCAAAFGPLFVFQFL